MFKAFRIIVSLILLFFIISEVNNEQIKTTFQLFHFNNFIIIFFLIFFSIFLIYKRFSFFVRFGYNLNLSLATKFYIFTTSIALSQLPLPGAQEVGKYYQLSKYCKNSELNFYLVALERFASLLASLFILIFLFLISLKFYHYKTELIQNNRLIVFALTILVFFIFFLSTKIFLNKLPYFSYIFNYLQFNVKNLKKFIFLSFFFSLFIQIFSNILGYYSLSILFKIDNHIQVFFILQFINILLSLPISFGGIGYREALYLSIFSHATNFDKIFVFSSSLVISVFAAIAILLLYVISFFFNRSKTRVKV
jgi:hypothetical protein